jgi:hypothetical protein
MAARARCGGQCRGTRRVVTRGPQLNPQPVTTVLPAPRPDEERDRWVAPPWTCAPSRTRTPPVGRLLPQPMSTRAGRDELVVASEPGVSRVGPRRGRCRHCRRGPADHGGCAAGLTGRWDRRCRWRDVGLDRDRSCQWITTELGQRVGLWCVLRCVLSGRGRVGGLGLVPTAAPPSGRQRMEDRGLLGDLRATRMPPWERSGVLHSREPSDPPPGRLTVRIPVDNGHELYLRDAPQAL